MSKSKSLTVAADVTALIRSRAPLIWVVTREEPRVEGFLFEAAAAALYKTRTWDVAQGWVEYGGNPDRYAQATDPGELITAIRTEAENEACREKRVWILRDFHSWLQPPVGVVTLRQMRNLVHLLPQVPPVRAQSIIVISPSGDVPAELATHATVIEWPLPDREEIGGILDESAEVFPTKKELAEEMAGEPDKARREALRKATLTREQVLTKDTREAAIDAAVGLSGEEARACFAKSLVQKRCIDPATVYVEKERVITRERVLELVKPLRGGLAAVGGLEVLKAWLVQRSSAYSAEARAYGLPAPRGALLVGVPGCGKSLTAKAIATAWGVPLVKLDLGALKSKFVGESEANMRRAFRTIEAIGRCVVWIDEVEKAIAGATQGAADGGVSSDALGSLLSWMQDRAGEAFVLATANDIEGLPPEFLRKGRFDDIWFVDVPNAVERVEVLKASLAAHDREKAKVNLTEVAAACEDFTGAEIASLVPDALFAAFNDGMREITTRDLLTAAGSVVRLTETAAEKINKLRDWAAKRAKAASAREKQMQRARDRARYVDL